MSRKITRMCEEYDVLESILNGEGSRSDDDTRGKMMALRDMAKTMDDYTIEHIKEHEVFEDINKKAKRIVGLIENAVKELKE